MGQKVNPVGLRLGINRTWDSRWFAKKADYGKLLHEDIKIRRQLKKRLYQAGVSRIIIERPHKKCRITIYAARPGVIIGKKGADIDKLRKEWRPDGLVVGDPMTLDGGDQPIRKFAHAFARELRRRYELPVVLVDERASSIEAAQRFAVDRAEGRRRLRDAAALDAVAAAVIVERWLAAPGDAIAVGPAP